MALWALEQKGGMGDTLRLLPLLWCENTKYKIISNEKKNTKAEIFRPFNWSYLYLRHWTGIKRSYLRHHNLFRPAVTKLSPYPGKESCNFSKIFGVQ